MKPKKRWFSILIIVLGVVIVSLSVWRIYHTKLEIFLTSPNGQIDDGNNISFPSSTFVKVTSQGGKSPAFSHDGDLLYYITPSFLLGSVELNNLQADIQEGVALPGNVDLLWDETRETAIVQWMVGAEGSGELGLLVLSEQGYIPLIKDAWGGTWTPDGSRITFIQRKEHQTYLSEMNKDGKRINQLVELTDMDMPEYVGWSSLGSRLIIQGQLGVAVYSVRDTAAVETTWIPWAKETKWSPDGWMIMYRQNEGAEDSLWITNLDGGDRRQIYQGVFSEVNWLPDGRLVFFTPGKEGGAACWVLDPLTGSQQLLADSSVVVWKPVGTIAVSPTGGALAFEAQDGQIWVLSFGDTSVSKSQ